MVTYEPVRPFVFDPVFTLRGKPASGCPRTSNSYRGAFRITDTVQSDSLEVTNMFLGTPRFPEGALIVQNGAAADPANISDINGFAYDGSTQFRLVSIKAILEAVLGPTR